MSVQFSVFYNLSLNLLRRDWRVGEWRVLLIALARRCGRQLHLAAGRVM